jgi:TPR repeat protein
VNTPNNAAPVRAAADNAPDDVWTAYRRGDYVSALGEVRPRADQGEPKAQYIFGLMYEHARGVPKDFAEARRWYGLAAEQGFADAQFRLGLMHHNGRGAAKDYAEAMRLYSLAAAQGSGAAHHTIGLMYYKGHGVAQDQAEALRRFRIAAELGDGPAQYILGAIYANGQGVAPDLAEALRWFMLAAEQGDVEAQCALAWLYDSGQGGGLAQDPAQAAHWYALAAEQGNAAAQASLGLMCATGRGVAQDFAGAIRWFRLAAEQGSAPAQANLGLLYASGQGVAQDPTEAARWFRFAAEQGDAGAQNNLGLMYHEGRGVARDDAEAMRWYRKSAEQGFAAAQHNLGLIYYQSRGVPQDLALALRWFRSAASQGNASAQYNMGLAYEQGDGVVQDYPEALKWYRLSAEQGYTNAQVNLGSMYRNGKGVAEDIAEAVKWYTRAAEQGDAGAWHNLGVEHLAAGRPREAIPCYDRALAINPAHADARLERGMAHLLLGDYARGWADYEARLETKTHQPRQLSGQRWRGQDLRGKTLFVYVEQGLGDSIQFARFVPRLAQLGLARLDARVALECHPLLFRLFQSLPGVDALSRYGDTPPAHDYYCSLLSLPFELGLNTQEECSADIPYLRAPSDAGAKLAPAFATVNRRLKVGIAWSGNAAFKGDQFKSTTLTTFSPLTKMPGVQLYSLQFGPRAEQLKTLGVGANIVDLAPLIDDFADTAVALARLDLVISVDTGLVHLAGALGRPTWVVLPYVSDFRWLTDREDSPWYPSLRLFRMTAENDWAGVIARVGDALKELTLKRAGGE